MSLRPFMGGNSYPGVMKKLARYMAHLRKKKGFTQAQVAQRMGVTVQAVYYLESGERAFYLPTILNWLDAIEIEKSNHVFKHIDAICKEQEISHE